MAKRKIIKIDEEKCNGCGLCIPNCPEGALQIIDGKVRLISDLFCDGLGACLGHCPEGAITIEEREAKPYDESKVMENIVKAGPNVIAAHLNHLKEHGEDEYLKQALNYLKKQNIEIPREEVLAHSHHGHEGCPGARTIEFSGQSKSQLSQWPIQLHLVLPLAPYFRGKDLLLAADCVAYAVGDFHNDYLKGKSLAIACPKLDEGMDVYLEKLVALIDQAKVNTLTVMTMEVPCCGGLLQLAQQAVAKSSRKVPIKSIVVGLQGDIIREEWVNT